MIFTVASALTYMKRRNLVDLFPQSLKNVWHEWELRVLILLSLAMQIVLILFGKRRKYIARTWIKFILWSAYLLADWFATVSLGVISNNTLEDYAAVSLGVISNTTCEHCSPCRTKGGADKELMSFWAPFLLLHLGGPDTITAYSLEDNELWLRHLLGLVVQMGVAMYICLMALPGKTCLPILSIPIFEAGLIKYGERTWALRSASIEHLRESMLTDPDAGPNYAKFMEEFTLKKAEGFHVKAAGVIEASDRHDPSPLPNTEHQLVVKAYDLFHTFKRLFVDLILSFQDRETSQTFFQKFSSGEDAFHVIEVELGFAFDVFYTKAPVMYTLGGCILRLASFCSVFGVLIAFVFFCDTHKDRYHKIDLIITYLLLVVAVVLEIYAVILMLRSDWTDYLLNKHNKTRDFLVVPCLKHPEKQWWSNSMAQHNLLSFCLEHKPPKCLGIQRLLQIDKLREKHCYKTFKTVSPGLKELIFKWFLDFIESSEDPQALCTERGRFVLQKYNCTSSLEWSITNVEFDKSLLIWHIATDLCYSVDGYQNTPNASHKEAYNCKLMSDYMLYLLVMCPSLLPMGIGMIRFRDTCAETWEFFEEMNLKSGKARVFCGEMSRKVGKAEACKKLLQVNTEVDPLIVKGDRSKSVLFEACRLAKSLRGIEERWEIMSLVWVEMLAHAATHCGGNQHAQQLRKGGELLTHVWLLMAHLGITEQFQIKKGHARAKLIVK